MIKIRNNILWLKINTTQLIYFNRCTNAYFFCFHRSMTFFISWFFSWYQCNLSYDKNKRYLHEMCQFCSDNGCTFWDEENERISLVYFMRTSSSFHNEIPQNKIKIFCQHVFSRDARYSNLRKHATSIHSGADADCPRAIKRRANIAVAHSRNIHPVEIWDDEWSREEDRNGV